MKITPHYFLLSIVLLSNHATYTYGPRKAMLKISKFLVGASILNNTLFSEYPATDLKTITQEIARDLHQLGKNTSLVLDNHLKPRIKEGQYYIATNIIPNAMQKYIAVKDNVQSWINSKK